MSNLQWARERERKSFSRLAFFFLTARNGRLRRNRWQTFSLCITFRFLQSIFWWILIDKLFSGKLWCKTDRECIITTATDLHTGDWLSDGSESIKWPERGIWSPIFNGFLSKSFPDAGVCFARTAHFGRTIKNDIAFERGKVLREMAAFFFSSWPSLAVYQKFSAKVTGDVMPCMSLQFIKSDISRWRKRGSPSLIKSFWFICQPTIACVASTATKTVNPFDESWTYERRANNCFSAEIFEIIRKILNTCVIQCLVF